MRTVALSFILLAAAATPALAADKLGNFEIQHLMSEANNTAADGSVGANMIQTKKVGGLDVSKSDSRSDLGQQLQMQLNEANMAEQKNLRAAQKHLEAQDGGQQLQFQIQVLTSDMQNAESVR